SFGERTIGGNQPAPVLFKARQKQAAKLRFFRDLVLGCQKSSELFQPLDAIQLSTNRLFIRTNGCASAISEERREEICHSKTFVGACSISDCGVRIEEDAPTLFQIRNPKSAFRNRTCPTPTFD